MGAAWNKPEQPGVAEDKSDQPGSRLGQNGSVWDQPGDQPGIYLEAAWNKPERAGTSLKALD